MIVVQHWICLQTLWHHSTASWKCPAVCKMLVSRTYLRYPQSMTPLQVRLISLTNSFVQQCGTWSGSSSCGVMAKLLDCGLKVSSNSMSDDLNWLPPEPRHTWPDLHIREYIWLKFGPSPVGQNCKSKRQYTPCATTKQVRIHWLYLCRGVRLPPMSVLDMALNYMMVHMTLNNLMMFQSFGECGAPNHCHRSQVQFCSKWKHLIGLYLWAK